jgi:hypothetical protein
MEVFMKADRISQLFAEPGPFASAYVEVSREQQDGDHLAQLEARAAADLLGSQGAPASVIEQVRSRLSESTHLPAPVSRFVVANENGVLFDELTHHHVPQPLAVWDLLPDISAWLADEDSDIPFVLALVDHEGGDVRSYRTSAFTPDEDVSVVGDTEYEHKIKGGGWNHLRFQHDVENTWRHNAAEVVTEIERQVAEGARLVLLAGDPQSCQQVTALLGDIRAELIQLESGSRNADGGEEALEHAVNQALYGSVVAAKLAEVHELQDRLGRDYAVAIGVADVADALVRGQVDRLLIDPAAAAGFTVEPEKHPGLVLGAATDLPPSLPADRALIAAAAITSADVVVTRSSTLGGAPVAALLRWDQTAVGSQA